MEISDADESDTNYSNFKDKIQISDVADLFEYCKNDCNIRYLSVLLYLTLRYFDISYKTAHTFLKDIGGLTDETAHKWANAFLDGKFDDFVGDARGGKRGDSFYDIYPELEQDARTFAVLECEKKIPVLQHSIWLNSSINVFMK